MRTTDDHTRPTPVDAADAADTGLDVVTGAFSYSGRAIARAAARARPRGAHAHRSPANGAGTRRRSRSGRSTSPTCPRSCATSKARPRSTTPTGSASRTASTTTTQAVENSRTLFHAAAPGRRAAHRARQHHPPDDRLAVPLFPRARRSSSGRSPRPACPYAILRPAILFGGDGVLVNNIAWLLRHLPVFAVGGRGDYRIRPIHVDDLARAVRRRRGRDRRRLHHRRGRTRAADVPRARRRRSATPSAAGRRIVRVPGAAAAADLVGARISRCTTCCSPATSTTRWPTGSPTPTAPATAPTASRDWLVDHGRRTSARATPTSSTATSARRLPPGRPSALTAPDAVLAPTGRLSPHLTWPVAPPAGGSHSRNDAVPSPAVGLGPPKSARKCGNWGSAAQFPHFGAG